MGYGDEGYQPQEYTMADQASATDRGQFIVKTYLHLLGAIIAFVGVETMLQITVAQSIMERMTGRNSNMGLLVAFGLFIFASHIANKWAHSDTSLSIQYFGLGLYVLVQALIFIPILYVATRYSSADVLPSAAMSTGFIFCGLTAVVIITRKNFSFLAPILGIASMMAIAFIVCSLIFGFNIGIVFTVLMIGLAAGYILYTTSNILHEYGTHQYVAASLALFAAVALLFMYILRLFMSRD